MNVKGMMVGLLGSALIATAAQAAPAREVNVHFRGVVDQGVPLDFGPMAPALRVKVGEMREMMYRFTNFSDKPLEIEAIHKIEPAQAEASFQKIQCFCFNRMTLKPHESKMMPVEFRVDPKLSASVPEIFLGYTVYRVHAVK